MQDGVVYLLIIIVIVVLVISNGLIINYSVETLNAPCRVTYPCSYTSFNQAIVATVRNDIYLSNIDIQTNRISVSQFDAWSQTDASFTWICIGF